MGPSRDYASPNSWFRSPCWNAGITGNIPSVDVQIQAGSLAVDVDLGKAGPSSSRLTVITRALDRRFGVLSRLTLSSGAYRRALLSGQWRLLPRNRRRPHVRLWSGSFGIRRRKRPAASSSVTVGVAISQRQFHCHISFCFHTSTQCRQSDRQSWCGGQHRITGLRAPWRQNGSRQCLCSWPLCKRPITHPHECCDSRPPPVLQFHRARGRSSQQGTAQCRRRCRANLSGLCPPLLAPPPDEGLDRHCGAFAPVNLYKLGDSSSRSSDPVRGL